MPIIYGSGLSGGWHEDADRLIDRWRWDHYVNETQEAIWHTWNSTSTYSANTMVNYTVTYDPMRLEYHYVSPNTTYTVTAEQVWQDWNRDRLTARQVYSMDDVYSWASDRVGMRPPEYDAEDRRRRAEYWARLREEQAERDRLHRQQIEERARQMQEAEDRAEALLRLVLSPEELAVYDDVGDIRITGSDGLEYEIMRHSYSGNVLQYDDQGRRTLQLCAHPNMTPGYRDGVYASMPNMDAFVAQVLALKTDAEGFLDTANIQQRYQQAA